MGIKEISREVRRMRSEKIARWDEEQMDREAY